VKGLVNFAVKTKLSCWRSHNFEIKNLKTGIEGELEEKGRFESITCRELTLGVVRFGRVDVKSPRDHSSFQRFILGPVFFFLRRFRISVQNKNFPRVQGTVRSKSKARRKTQK